MNTNELEKLELDLLLDALNKRYGYDFRSYSKASIMRRVNQFIANKSYNSIAYVIPEILHNQDLLSDFVQYLSIPVTEMFRDPFVYAGLRRIVIPELRSYPHIKIWIAGCATGEEVYSIAILLKEEGLYEKTKIYGTDFNDTALEKAKNGIYHLRDMKSYTQNYINSGGHNEFSDYYNAGYDSVIIDQSLKKNITFANHNLVCDKVFGEMNLILCRNVLIYFNNDLQNRVLELFTHSLVHNGYLCLGTKESISFTHVENSYNLIDRKMQIYKKTVL